MFAKNQNRKWLGWAQLAVWATLGFTNSWGVTPNLVTLDQDVTKPLGISDISYATFGDAKNEPVVLVHGLGSNKATFVSVIRELHKNYFVIVYDQRGHGKTQDQGSDYSPLVMAQDLDLLLKELKITSAHFIGHSFGARTVMQFAQLNPGAVKSVVLEDMDMAKRWANTPEVKKKYFAQAEAQKAQAIKSYNAGIKWEKVRVGYVNTLYNYYSNSTSLRESLKSAKDAGFPVLILGADQKFGSGITPDGLEDFQTLLPHAKIHVIPGAQHDIHNSQTEIYNSEVLRFLKEVAGETL